jgi:hypothetical protein
MAKGGVKRPMSERRKTWRADVEAHPSDWDTAYSWLRAELADLERACRRGLWLRIRTSRLRGSVRSDATASLVEAVRQVGENMSEEDREGQSWRARRGEFAGARTADERMWTARGWLFWCETYVPLPDDVRAQLAGALVAQCGRVTAVRGNG